MYNADVVKENVKNRQIEQRLDALIDANRRLIAPDFVRRAK